MAWYVIRTNIKSEDKAERNLRDAGFATYAPWQKFERFWNEDHTEGYEATEEVHRLMPLLSSQMRPIKAGEVIPYWLQGIVLKPGGVEAYRSKAKEHNNIKGS